MCKGAPSVERLQIYRKSAAADSQMILSAVKRMTQMKTSPRVTVSQSKKYNQVFKLTFVHIPITFHFHIHHVFLNL